MQTTPSSPELTDVDGAVIQPPPKDAPTLQRSLGTAEATVMGAAYARLLTPIWIFAPTSGQTLYANPAALALFGVGDVIGMAQAGATDPRLLPAPGGWNGPFRPHVVIRDGAQKPRRVDCVVTPAPLWGEDAVMVETSALEVDRGSVERVRCGQS